MRIYLSQPSGYATNLTRFLTYVTKLYLAGFLDDESTVWINTNISRRLFWVYAGRPALVFWVETPTAGFVRLSNGRARWGATWRESQNAPAFDLRPDTIAALGSYRPTTVVIDHLYTPDGGEGVGIVDSATTPSTTGGYYENADFAVVDLPYFQPQVAPFRAATTHHDDAARTMALGVAAHHGARLLEIGMSNEQVVALRTDINTHHYVDLPPETFAQLGQSLDAFRIVADFAVKTTANT